MKSILLTITLAAICLSASAQADPNLVIDAGTVQTTSRDNGGVALMFGFSNYNNDQFAVGPLVERYGSVVKSGLRITTNLTLAGNLYFYVQGDVNFKSNSPHDWNFLEMGGGLGLRFLKYLRISAGYEMNDFNPETGKNREDGLATKFGVNIPLFNDER